MRKSLILLICLFLLCFIIGVGDYLNLPLWPIDFFSKRCPVDIQFSLENTSLEDAENMIKSIAGIPVSIFSVSNEIIYKTKSDLTGRIHVVLPVGRFKVFAQFIAVNEGKCIQFSTFDESHNDKFNTIEIQKQKYKYFIPLKSKSYIPPQLLSKTLSLFLKSGNFKAALVIAKKINTQTYNEIRRAQDLIEQIHLLPIFAYNSKIECLREIKSILNRYCDSNSEIFINLNDEKIVLNSYLKAVVKARNQVLKWFLKQMKSSYEAGRLENVLGIWNKLSRDEELFPKDDIIFEETKAIKTQLDDFKDRVQEIADQVQDDIHYTFEEIIKIYEKGELEHARRDFSRLLSDIRDLEMQNEFLHMNLEIQSYLDDIALIAAADQAMRNDNLEKALEIFDVILHPNALVIRKIEETKKFMNLKSHQL